ncbi:transposon Tf2-9 polyprotein [Trichonephila clavipes]|nr:transposon Tf2-9 polyprotein [Trichonephila clavipes]
MGAVLTQLTEQGEEHPILYLSKKFSEVEKRYCTTEKECASIVFPIKGLHYYLDGNSFLVMTDHNPLVWLNRNGLGSNPREDMDVSKCIAPSRHGGTINSRQAASPLVRLVKGEEMSEAPEHHQVSTSKLGWKRGKLHCHLYGAQSYG